MAIEALPVLAADLVERLDEEFPARCIGPTQTPEAAHRYAGKRDLIDFLVNLLREAEDNALSEELGNVQAGHPRPG